jgi:hypothetical protein
MSVVTDDGRITVEPDDIDVNDFLEYAEAAILRYGWRQGERKEVPTDDMVEVAKKDGLSLHDAIGYTNVILGGEVVGEPTGKDAPTRTWQSRRSMREEMTVAVNAVLPKGDDDKTFNDKAKSQDEVIAVLRKARGAA